jgi:hypothetical protein
VGLPDSHPIVQRRRADAADLPDTNIWGRVTAGYLAGRSQASETGDDLAAAYERERADAYPAEKLIKLACVFELIGLPDCAAEMLNGFHARLTAFGELEPLLDALTPPFQGEQLNYREYIARFEQEPGLFLPSAEGWQAIGSDETHD